MTLSCVTYVSYLLRLVKPSLSPFSAAYRYDVGAVRHRQVSTWHGMADTGGGSIQGGKAAPMARLFAPLFRISPHYLLPGSHARHMYICAKQAFNFNPRRASSYP